MILFSINPAFDMLPASEDIDTMFAEEFDAGLKGFAGGRLFDAKCSPFGVSLTPVQCIHYALTRPATVQSHYELLEHKASECIGCHACESRCPFGVSIAERMEKTAELL